MARSLARQLCLLFAVTACLLASGCGSRVNKSNYDKINTGMSVSEVEGILGKGEEQASTGINIPAVNVDIPGGAKIDIPGSAAMSAKIVKWQDGNKMITITFFSFSINAILHPDKMTR